MKIQPQCECFGFYVVLFDINYSYVYTRLCKLFTFVYKYCFNFTLLKLYLSKKFMLYY